MDYNEDRSSGMRQKDLVLSTNEFCFVQSRTNGVIKTYTGPIMLTISQQESLVYFDEKSKRFVETADFERAKQLFISPPENWYVVLKNPAMDGTHPEIGKSVISPELEIGKKVNISGPCTFSLYPGQMARVIQGHRLRSNQYLLARVYDAESAEKSISEGTIVDTSGENIEKHEKYFSGQLLVIKGTEVSFYIPPTGIEVIPIDNDPYKGYVREAVTLERLEYAILKDENGNKEYIHGPKVVFPKPTESFVSNNKGELVFKAIELSKISGIYVKVIAEYTENKVKHPVGEELFITGEDQMIYYPRPEHAIINYDGKIIHHAIAIPKGEGRYIMNRLTGEITTKIGPAMYLPDPRVEVVVKRKLTPKQCELWYPGNTEAYNYNKSLGEKDIKPANSLANAISELGHACGYRTTNYMVATSTANDAWPAALFDYASGEEIDKEDLDTGIDRKSNYTKPRTIVIDNKYDGVVSLDIWTGYAINVVSKNGDRKVVCGPQTVLLDYDQTLEVLQLSTGKPKTTDKLISTVYLRYENNKISDIIHVETKDFVGADIKVSYSVNFLTDYKDKWFNVQNYVKYMCDRQRSLIRKAAKDYNIEEFYQNYAEIVRNIALDKDNEETKGRFFEENGMLVHDVEVLGIQIDSEIQSLLHDKQYDTIKAGFELLNASQMTSIMEELAEAKSKQAQINHETELKELELEAQAEMQKLATREEIAKKEEEVKQLEREINLTRENFRSEIAEIQRNKEKLDAEFEIEKQKQRQELELVRQQAYADTIASIMSSIQPDLVAALNAQSETDMIRTISENLSPYAIANGEGVADVVNKLLRGLPLDNALKAITE